MNGGSGEARDTLFGGAGNDILEGGRLDTLVGGFGSDVYRVDEEYGVRIHEQDGGGTDRLELPEGITAENVSFSRLEDFLYVTVTVDGASRRITIQDHFSADGSNRIEVLRYASGEEVDLTNPVLSSSSFGSGVVGGEADDTLVGGERDEVLLGNSGDDFIDGDGGNDSLVGGPGDDTLRGGSGNDTYEWVIGDGRDIIDEQGGGGEDTLVIDRALRLSDLTFSRDGDNLRIEIGSIGEILIVDQFAEGEDSKIETLHYLDGSGFVDFDLNDAPLSPSSTATTQAQASSESEPLSTASAQESYTVGRVTDEVAIFDPQSAGL